jgi:hypothetical protein
MQTIGVRPAGDKAITVFGYTISVWNFLARYRTKRCKYVHIILPCQSVCPPFKNIFVRVKTEDFHENLSTHDTYRQNRKIVDNFVKHFYRVLQIHEKMQPTKYASMC